ncbi:ATP-binding cassette domain-containing protein [Cerasicoccus maritimus]|uniref:ATP-binding cassette domain-containing protein n=1 Tax=Cerasicoccus maritimus TaxID=490089 RepID=UPI0028525661|nr:ATP-binding cassette domain-containing protein [Cerasicoccus maritimus]
MFAFSEFRVAAGETNILQPMSGQFMSGQLNAVVGPSGCGKTTLVNSLLGLTDCEGEVRYNGAPVDLQSTTLAGRVGMVPQFSVAHEDLTVREVLCFAFDLTVSGSVKRDERVGDVLELVGLSEHADKLVKSLSGGQMRRLGLALELVSDPECLICDEVTSGLDPLSEDQILSLLRLLADQRNKTFLCIIHNLSKLPEFDSITVLYEGYLVFQGNYSALREWFNLSDPLKLYFVLSQDSPEAWAERWEPHAQDRVVEKTTTQTAHQPLPKPSAFRQLLTLIQRRIRLLARDTGYVWLLLALTFGFPCIVVIFALKGLPQIEGLALERTGSFIQQIQQNLRFQMDSAETASLVTGLIMFQVVLLTLMGANNGAREIASERHILEKEKISGLRPWCYSLSKLIFVGGIAIFQGVWMTLFVKIICQFPGSFIMQATILSLCCLSMTWVCLGMSAVFASTEKASLLSIYLVGFQLPLSGVVLALPDMVVWVLRPFINAFWSWSGYLVTMKDYQVYDAYRIRDTSWLPSENLAGLVLIVQAICGGVAVFWGVKKRH